MKGLAFMKSYHELKSGSDVRGYASDIFGNEIELTDKAVYDITAAFVPFLSKIWQRAGDAHRIGRSRLKNNGRADKGAGYLGALRRRSKRHRLRSLINACDVHDNGHGRL